MIYTAHVHSPHVFIQYQNDQMASQAIWVLQGKCIPGTYCQLDIQLAQGSDLHTFQDYSYEMNFQSDTMDHKTPTIDRRMDILNMLAQVQAKLNTISENLSRDLKRMESRESKQSAATQEAGMAPVMCSKTNNTVSSESLLVPNQQLPMNVQDASHVFKETPVYDIYEEDVTAGRCCLYPSVDTIAAVAEEVEVKIDSDKPIISPERPTVRTIGAFSLTNEKSICDLEKMNAGENLSFATQDKEQLIQYFSIVAAFRNVPDVYVTRTCYEESQGNAKLFREKYVCQIVTGLSILLFPWDPGARKFPVLFITVAQVRKLLCTDVFKSELTCSSEIQKLLNSWVNLKKMIPWPAWKLQLSTPLKLFMQSLCANTAAQMTKQRHHLEFLVMDQMLQNLNEFRDGQLAYISQGNSIHSPEWVRPIITVFSCWLPSLEMAKLQWDPGITLSSEMYTLLEILSGGCKIVQPKHFWAYLLLQYHSWCPTPNASFQAQDPCLPIVLDCLHSEPFKQLDRYSNIFNSTAMYISTATHVHRRSVLSFGKIAQAEKDAAAMYHVLKIQLPMSTTSHIWNPGIESSLFLYKGLHICMIQQVDYSVIHACDLVFALLPPTQIAACYPSNIKQGIQENYNAKHLMLSSQDYVNSQEIDIIFMTFRPP